MWKEPKVEHMECLLLEFSPFSVFAFVSFVETSTGFLHIVEFYGEGVALLVDEFIVVNKVMEFPVQVGLM